LVSVVPRTTESHSRNDLIASIIAGSFGGKHLTPGRLRTAAKNAERGTRTSPGRDQVFFAIFADFFAIFVLKGFLLG
jgi:hypothetical protein